MAKGRKVSVLEGVGKFTSPNMVEVAGKDGVAGSVASNVAGGVRGGEGGLHGGRRQSLRCPQCAP